MLSLKSVNLPHFIGDYRQSSTSLPGLSEPITAGNREVAARKKQERSLEQVLLWVCNQTRFPPHHGHEQTLLKSTNLWISQEKTAGDVETVKRAQKCF